VEAIATQDKLSAGSLSPPPPLASSSDKVAKQAFLLQYRDVSLNGLLALAASLQPCVRFSVPVYIAATGTLSKQN
jgi:hypothetical protein